VSKFLDKVADAIFPVERPVWVSPKQYEWGTRQKRRSVRLMLLGIVVALASWLLFGLPAAVFGAAIIAIGFVLLYLGSYMQYPTPPG
jgi:hypothetical protein